MVILFAISSEARWAAERPQGSERCLCFGQAFVKRLLLMYFYTTFEAKLLVV